MIDKKYWIVVIVVGVLLVLAGVVYSNAPRKNNLSKFCDDMCKIDKDILNFQIKQLTDRKLQLEKDLVRQQKESAENVKETETRLQDQIRELTKRSAQVLEERKQDRELWQQQQKNKVESCENLSKLIESMKNSSKSTQDFAKTMRDEMEKQMANQQRSIDAILDSRLQP